MGVVRTYTQKRDFRTLFGPDVMGLEPKDPRTTLPGLIDGEVTEEGSYFTTKSIDNDTSSSGGFGSPNFGV